MKQVLVRGGNVLVQQVPSPHVSPRNILVRVAHSCISVGTELAGVRMSGLPLYRRALKQPHHVKRVVQIMRDQGFKRTFDRITSQLNAGLPLGYSAAGTVIEAGAEVETFGAGDLVACAGAGVANHAEVIDVPVHLAVKLPSGLDTAEGCTVAMGAIALQGLRRANPTLGESVVVIGLGLLGQITTQLLRANGCRVIGVDLDASRIQCAQDNGLDVGVSSREEDIVERIHKLTGGFGADAVIVTAATSAHELIAQAMRSCRKKGRVVVVGDVGLNLNRADMYAQEIDFLISCSYGPGRYDSLYEDHGRDYPLPYVRWTENRNMEEYLRLLSEGRVKLQNMNAKVFPVDQAAQAYELLGQDGSKPLLVTLSYPQSETATERIVHLRRAGPDRLPTRRIRVGLAGAGAFAQAMHLPNLAKRGNDFELHCVMSRTGANARAVADRFRAAYATTNYDQLLEDENVDLVLIATRHHLHGQMVLRALHAGKHVFVEKPLTIFPQELGAIEEFYRNHRNPPLLMVGFNRRFSPAARRIQQLLAQRTTPLIVNYRMNAGFLSVDHWAHSPEGGGRNLGEACHIYDLFNALVGSEYLAVSARSIVPSSGQWKKNDNFVSVISYADGSLASLIYTALGVNSFPKETMEIFGDGRVISLNDYKSVSVTGGRHKTWRTIIQDKGQLDELNAVAGCLLRGEAWPIPLPQMIAATRIAFEVERQITGANADSVD